MMLFSNVRIIWDIFPLLLELLGMTVMTVNDNQYPQISSSWEPSV